MHGAKLVVGRNVALSAQKLQVPATLGFSSGVGLDASAAPFSRTVIAPSPLEILTAGSPLTRVRAAAGPDAAPLVPLTPLAALGPLDPLRPLEALGPLGPLGLELPLGPVPSAIALDAAMAHDRDCQCGGERSCSLRAQVLGT